jgi:AcrR family transcriptional regulator
MAYEVVKTIGTRQYRYRVQSERDALTGKTRNRWTYLGRVAGEGADDGKTRPARGTTRLRLIEAAGRLLATGDAGALTVDAIAAEAGVAHGTFYRYFRDRSDVLEALARHLRDSGTVGDERLLDDAVTTLGAARAGVRRWVSERLRYARLNRASFCAWTTLIASDARLSAFREDRRETMLARLREHIEALCAKGFTEVADSAATSAALLALVDGVMRAAILERDRLDDAGITATADIAERALFARLP